MNCVIGHSKFFCRPNRLSFTQLKSQHSVKNQPNTECHIKGSVQILHKIQTCLTQAYIKMC